MALKFQPPFDIQQAKHPLQALAESLGPALQTVPALWAKYKADQKRRKTQMGAIQEAFPGQIIPEGLDDPNLALNVIGKKAQLESDGRVPYSFQGEFVDRLRSGGPIMDERLGQAIEEYSKTFPKVVTDPLGSPHRMSPTGPQKIFPQTVGDEPENALVKLRQTAPKLADNFDEILNQSLPQNNQFLKTNIEGASAAAQVKAILKDPNPSQVGLQSLGFYFARMSGSNSQLSDREREVFENPLSLIDNVVNRGYRLTAGDLSPMMKRDLLKLADTISGKARTQAEKIMSTQKQRAKSALGQFYTPGIDSSFPSVESLIVSTQDVLSNETPTAGVGWSEEKESRYQYLQRKREGR